MNRTSQGSFSDSRRLILIRHAHRDNSDRSADNGLSPQGRTQAQMLLNLFKARLDLSSCVFESSPKLRCIETLEPMAGERLQISPLLDEQGPFESVKSLESRIESYIENFKASSERNIIACSHGDWIPQFVLKISGLATELGKSGWLEIEYRPNEDPEFRILDSQFSVN